MANFDRLHCFVGTQPDYYDLYLVSCCKHQIINSPTFSWRAAYVNKSEEKRFIAPDPWFTFSSDHNSNYVVPVSWQKLSWQDL